MRSKTPCSLCDEGSANKLASAYWSWILPSGERRSYKQFFDRECIQTVRNLIETYGDPSECCPSCGQVASQFPRVTLFLTLYVPLNDRHDNSFYYHMDCWEKACETFSHNAVRLPDRSGGERGAPRPTPGNPWTSWGAMGIEPTERRLDGR